jgi:hypothetical protein
MMQDYAYWRYTVAFSNDGKRLAAGQRKTNWMNLWDLPAEKPGKEKALTDVQLESLWADLLDEKDGVKTYRAILGMIQAPSQTVAFVNKQLDKVPLDSPENDQRLRAARTVEVLERIGNRECRQILDRLAKNAKSAPLRDDARRALRRCRSHFHKCSSVAFKSSLRQMEPFTRLTRINDAGVHIHLLRDPHADAATLSFLPKARFHTD